MSLRYKVILFVVCLIALVLFQAKVIMPFVYEVVSSDLFLEESDDVAELNAINTDMTGYAFDQCNIYIANELDSDFTASFTAQPINAWGIGNYQYVINADIDLTPTDAQTFTRRYVCRIKYDKGNDQSGVTNPDNWTIEGVSGLEEL